MEATWAGSAQPRGSPGKTWEAGKNYTQPRTNFLTIVAFALKLARRLPHWNIFGGNGVNNT